MKRKESIFGKHYEDCVWANDNTKCDLDTCNCVWYNMAKIRREADARKTIQNYQNIYSTIKNQIINIH